MLTATKTNRVPAKPNTYVWYGYGSSPSGRLVMDVSDNFVTVRSYPYTPKSEYRTTRTEFEMLAYKGCMTRLGQLKAVRDMNAESDEKDGIDQRITELEATMRGEGPTVDPVSFERCTFVARYVGKRDHLRSKDPWYAAEHYGGVGAQEEYGITMYFIEGSIGSMRELVASGDWVVMGFANSIEE